LTNANNFNATSSLTGSASTFSIFDLSVIPNARSTAAYCSGVALIKRDNNSVEIAALTISPGQIHLCNARTLA
jgi:hypothetical protein